MQMDRQDSLVIDWFTATLNKNQCSGQGFHLLKKKKDILL